MTCGSHEINASLGNRKHQDLGRDPENRRESSKIPRVLELLGNMLEDPGLSDAMLCFFMECNSPSFKSELMRFCKQSGAGHHACAARSCGSADDI